MGSLTILNTTKPNPPLLYSPLSPPLLFKNSNFPPNRNDPFPQRSNFEPRPSNPVLFPPATVIMVLVNYLFAA